MAVTTNGTRTIDNGYLQRQIVRVARGWQLLLRSFTPQPALLGARCASGRERPCYPHGDRRMCEPVTLRSEPISSGHKRSRS